MSTQKNHYVILGNKYEYKDFYNRVAQKNRFNEPMTRDNFLATWREDVEKLYYDSAFGGIGNHNSITIINDGMNGEYVYIGFVISKSKNDGNLDDFTAIPPIWDDVGDLIWKAVGFAKDIEILPFTHYR